MKSVKSHARNKAPVPWSPATQPRHSANARKPPSPQSSSSEDDDDESWSSDGAIDDGSDSDSSSSRSNHEASSSSDHGVKRGSNLDSIAALRARYTAAASSGEDGDEEKDGQSEQGTDESEDEEEEDDEQPPVSDSESDQSEPNEEEDSEKEEGGLSFAEIAQRRETMGKKAYLESMAEQERQKKAGGKGASKPKRVNKNAPMEMTSKRPVSRFREAVKVQKIERRDPRFDNLSGHFNQGLFDKAYGFVYDMRSQEIHQLKQQLAKEKNPNEAQQLMRTIQAMENRERARKEAEVKQRIKRDWRKQELNKVKEGKKPFFLKQSEQKKLYLINKLKDRSDRELDKVAEKKRKRDAGKDWKWMPKRRRVADGGA